MFGWDSWCFGKRALGVVSEFPFWILEEDRGLVLRTDELEDIW